MKSNKLCGIIVAKGMTQERVARQIGISPKTFYNKMKKGVFDTDEVRKMAAVLEINDLTELADIFLRDRKDEYTDLSEVKTCDLVRELQNREGVEMQAAGPDEVVQLQVTGPATVLVIID